MSLFGKALTKTARDCDFAPELYEAMRALRIWQKSELAIIDRIQRNAGSTEDKRLFNCMLRRTTINLNSYK